VQNWYTGLGLNCPSTFLLVPCLKLEFERVVWELHLPVLVKGRFGIGLGCVLPHTLFSRCSASCVWECSCDKPPFNFVRGRVDDVGHRLLFITGTQISGCLIPFLLTGTTVTVSSPEIVKQKPLLSCFRC